MLTSETKCGIGFGLRHPILFSKECRSFRQPSVRKRVGSIRKRPIVGSQTSYITRTLYCVQG